MKPYPAYFKEPRDVQETCLTSFIIALPFEDAVRCLQIGGVAIDNAYALVNAAHQLNWDCYLLAKQENEKKK